MNVSNNRPIGPVPSEQGSSKLDPDLTKVNRDGVEYTREMVREHTSTANEKVLEQQETKVSATRSKLSREMVELSNESRRLAAEESLGPGGKRETSEDRDARIAELEESHRSGNLNTTDRARAAAGRLLGGE